MGVNILLSACYLLLSIGLNDGFRQDISILSQNCGSTIDFTAATSFTLGRNATQGDDEEDNGYCNVTFISADNMSLQIVDYLFYAPISYVYMKSELSSTCVQKFLSISGNLTSCGGVLVGKSLTLHIQNAILEVHVAVVNSSSSRCSLNCNGTNSATNIMYSSHCRDCLMSGYDTVYKMKSYEDYNLPSCKSFVTYPLRFCEKVRFYHFGLSCPKFCHCTLGKSKWTQTCSRQNLTSLIVYDPYVTALSLSKTGIQIMSNSAFDNLFDLKVLHLDQNYITNLPSGIFNDLIDLMVFSLEFNFIRELPFDLFHSLYNLTFLDMGNNLITHIPFGLFKNLNNVAKLNLSSNFIVSLPQSSFISLYRLKWLYLSNNKLRELPGYLFYFTWLEWLYLDHNHLEYLPYNLFVTHSDYLLPLMLLDLSYNRLKSLPKDLGDPLGSLFFLRINGNDLSDIHDNSLINCTSLATLYLNNNRLTVLSNKTSQLSLLFVLDIGYNKLTWLPEGIFDSLLKLLHLNIENNHLSYLPRNIFKSLASLTFLGLNGNFILELSSETFASMTELKYLFFSNNELTEISHDVFSHLSNLIVLDIGGNKLNQVASSAFDDLINLGYLNLARNNISSLPNFKGLRKLSVLDLSINSLLNASAHVFKGLSSLEFLNVSHNNLENLPSNVFNQLTNLISLDLSDNKLKTIHQDLFCNQSKLVRLSIAGNYLPYLNTYMFDDLKELVHLDLQKNIISFLQPEDFLNLISLQFLNLSGNFSAGNCSKHI